jgi:AcrR family transcriptional regulator
VKSRRRYEQRLRAQAQEATRRRIVEAVVALHEEVGPAATTVSEVARRAGVSRPTVYSHFPGEEALFAACSSYWLEANPPPDTRAWEGIGDPDRRVERALSDLYAYYERCRPMLANVVRDAQLLPSLAGTVDRNFGGYAAEALRVLLRGRDARAGARARRAALLLGLDFQTWATLTGRAGLDTEQAASFAAGLVACASSAAPDGGQRSAGDGP